MTDFDARYEDEEAGGEPACALAHVCPECGTLREVAAPAVCVECGALPPD